MIYNLKKIGEPGGKEKNLHFEPKQICVQNNK